MKITAIYKTDDGSNDVLTLEKEKVEIRYGNIFVYNKLGVMTGSHSLDAFECIVIDNGTEETTNKRLAKLSEQFKGENIFD